MNGPLELDTSYFYFIALIGLKLVCLELFFYTLVYLLFFYLSLFIYIFFKFIYILDLVSNVKCFDWHFII